MSYIQRIRDKYIGSYGNEVLDRFYDMSLNDRLKLIDKLLRLNKEIQSSEYKCHCIDHKEDLEIVRDVTLAIKQAKQFPEFYNSLNDKQKKEIQTQVYIESEESKRWAIIKNKHKYISRIFAPYRETDKSEKETFKFDIKLLNEELDTYRLLSKTELVETFCSFYSEYAFDNYLDWNYDYKDPKVKQYRRTYTVPLLKEFNNAMTEVVRVLDNNLNDSTKKEFNSLTPEQQIYVLFEILNINEEYLNHYIEYRNEQRQKVKQNKVYNRRMNYDLYK